MNLIWADGAELQMHLTLTRFKEWVTDDFFRLRWWGIVLLFVVDIYFWWKYVDKTRLSEIILFASATAVMILILDELGEELTLWYYPTDAFPLFPPVEAVDIACLPFLYSFIYQYCRTWKSFTRAAAVMSVFSCFVFEPIFLWLGMYKTITWKVYYGLPLYFAIGMAAKAATALVMHTMRKKRASV